MRLWPTKKHFSAQLTLRLCFQEYTSAISHTISLEKFNSNISFQTNSKWFWLFSIITFTFKNISSQRITMKFPGNYSECIEESGNFVVGVVTQVIVHGSSMGRTLRAHINSSLVIWISETIQFDKTRNILSLQLKISHVQNLARKITQYVKLFDKEWIL